jgi:hypothetical protein
VETYGTARQATDDNIIFFACWITKAADAQNMYDFLLFHGSNGYANAPKCYVIRTRLSFVVLKCINWRPTSLRLLVRGCAFFRHPMCDVNSCLLFVGKELSYRPVSYRRSGCACAWGSRCPRHTLQAT